MEDKPKMMTRKYIDPTSKEVYMTISIVHNEALDGLWTSDKDEVIQNFYLPKEEYLRRNS